VVQTIREAFAQAGTCPLDEVHRFLALATMEGGLGRFFNRRMMIPNVNNASSKKK